MTQVSVILPTHNPRQVPLERTLDGLRQQSLNPADWELLLIDNRSDQPLAGRIDLGWHPNAKIIREDTLGLTPARLTGIDAANADILIFVDDDNVLRSNFLSQALTIASQQPTIGAWGGAVLPEFEAQPEEWTQDYWFMLALRECKEAITAYDTTTPQALPCGAGLCVRKPVAHQYRDNVGGNSLRASLDRCGGSLASSGDTDIAFTAIDMGLGIGLFPELQLIHLIPPGRLEKPYLLRLWEDMNYSHHLMRYIRHGFITLPPADLKDWLRRSLKPLVLTGLEKEMHAAAQRGIKRAQTAVEQHENHSATTAATS